MKRFKLAPKIYDHLIKRAVEHDAWRYRKCGSLENLLVRHEVHRCQQSDDSLRELTTLRAHCHMAEEGLL